MGKKKGRARGRRSKIESSDDEEEDFLQESGMHGMAMGAAFGGRGMNMRGRGPPPPPQAAMMKRGQGQGGGRFGGTATMKGGTGQGGGRFGDTNQNVGQGGNEAGQTSEDLQPGDMDNNNQSIENDTTNVEDYTLLPSLLEKRCTEIDPTAKLRPTIIKVSSGWKKNYKESILSPLASTTLLDSQTKEETTAGHFAPVVERVFLVVLGGERTVLRLAEIEATHLLLFCAYPEEDVLFDRPVEEVDLLCDHRNHFPEGPRLVGLNRLAVDFDASGASVDVILTLDERERGALAAAPFAAERDRAARRNVHRKSAHDAVLGHGRVGERHVFDLDVESSVQQVLGHVKAFWVTRVRLDGRLAFNHSEHSLGGLKRPRKLREQIDHPVTDDVNEAPQVVAEEENVDRFQSSELHKFHGLVLVHADRTTGEDHKENPCSVPKEMTLDMLTTLRVLRVLVLLHFDAFASEFAYGLHVAQHFVAVLARGATLPAH